MGQYYLAVIVAQKDGELKANVFNPYSYGQNGLKLMEHSWLGNRFVNAVLNHLYNKPGRLAWIGDYAELKDYQSEEIGKLFECVCNNAHSKYKGTTAKELKAKYLVNHTKGQVFCFREYEFNAPRHENLWGMIVNPIPLLTAVGNGKGGGDYFGTNQKMVGSWAGDELELVDAMPESYLNITSNCYLFNK